MRWRPLRVALFAAIVAAMCAVAFPVMAAPAPFCDDRGASALAPPPMLQPMDEAIAKVLVAPTCLFDEPSLSPVVSAHRPLVFSLASSEPVQQTAPPRVPRCPALRASQVEVGGTGLSGVRARVERPPRG